MSGATGVFCRTIREKGTRGKGGNRGLAVIFLLKIIPRVDRNALRDKTKQSPFAKPMHTPCSCGG